MHTGRGRGLSQASALAASFRVSDVICQDRCVCTCAGGGVSSHRLFLHRVLWFWPQRGLEGLLLFNLWGRVCVGVVLVAPSRLAEVSIPAVWALSVDPVLPNQDPVLPKHTRHFQQRGANVECWLPAWWVGEQSWHGGAQHWSSRKQLPLPGLQGQSGRDRPPEHKRRGRGGVSRWVQQHWHVRSQRLQETSSVARGALARNLTHPSSQQHLPGAVRPGRLEVPSENPWPCVSVSYCCIRKHQAPSGLKQRTVGRCVCTRALAHRSIYTRVLQCP